jgi:hypothetical protein
MKAKIIPILALCCIFSFFFFSCEDSTYKEYKGNEPVYLSFEDLRSSMVIEQNADLKNPGKIYFKDNYIFIVEELQGIHVFDNTDPAAPVNKSFIKLPGVADIAISGNIMYADSYVDLAIIDLQDVSNIREVGRMKDIIPYSVPATGNSFPIGPVDKTRGVVTGWKLKTIRERINDEHVVYPVFLYKTDGLFSEAITGGLESSGVSGSGVGIGGSMARFGIKDKILYLMENGIINILDISAKSNPVILNHLHVGATVETMFLKDKNMFLGTTTGMIIYDIAVPSAPVYKTNFRHARSCDPVIVDDTLAYITLRSGTTCGGVLNNLDILNVKDISKPVMVVSYGMTNPHGLGKSGKLLFVCDGTAGLKIFDATNPKELLTRVVKTYPGINAFDVIPLGSVLVMIGDDGLFQYNYTDIQNITLLSKIETVKN